jgi:hypothetical protein
MPAQPERSRLAITPLEGLMRQFDELALQYPDIRHVYVEYPHETTPDLSLENDAYFRGAGARSTYELSHAVYRDNRWLRLSPKLQNGGRDWMGIYFGSGTSKFDALAMSVDFLLTSYPIRIPLPQEIRELAKRFSYSPADAIILPCGRHRWARMLHWLGWEGVVMPITRLVWNGIDSKVLEPSLDADLRVTSFADNLFLRSALAIKWIVDDLSNGDEQRRSAKIECRPKKRIGRTPDTDPEKDRRVAEAWRAGHFRTYADLDSALQLDRGSAKKAVDRHRHRERDGKSR